MSRILNAVRNRSALALGAMMAAFVFAALLGVACGSSVSSPLPEESDAVATNEGASIVEDSAAVPATPDMTYKIAFGSELDGNGEIYTADADGENIQRVTFTPLFYESPDDWSPDGSLISYTLLSREGDGLKSSIHTINVDGSGQRAILELGGNYLSPIFSPQGQELVFQSYVGGNSDIYTIGIDGENPRQITFSDNSDTRPDWSPDGRQIVYASGRGKDGDWQIYLLDLDTGEERRITSGSAKHREPRFSPNGKETAYSRFSGDIGANNSISEVFIFNLETLATRQVTQLGRFSGGASWSPDGKFIYFTLRELVDSEKSDIYRISPDGGPPEVVIQSEFPEGVVVVSPFIER